MDNKKIKRTAKGALSGNWGAGIAIMIVGGLLTGALSATLVGTLAAVVVSFGMVYSYLNIARGRANGSLQDLFAGFSNFGTVLIANLLTGLYTALWYLLLIVPGIIKSYSYALTNFIIADDPTINPSDAIKKSRELMNGHKWELFCLDMSFIGWYLLVGLTFGLLSLYVTPYHYTAKAAFYDTLIGNDVVVEDFAEVE